MRLWILILLAVSATATTTIRVDGVTATQAIITVVTDQAVGFCTIRVSEGSTFLANVIDVDTSVLPTAVNRDSRPGSVINGTVRTFVAGRRASTRGIDGKMYSRALQNNTTHWAGAQCGADAEVSTTFTTVNPPLGSTFAESFPYHSSGFGNYAWPTIDFEDLTKTYIEPTTGTKLRLLTFGNLNSPSPQTGSIAQEALEPTASAWTTPANGAVIDAAFAVNSTTNDPLFIRFNPVCATGSINLCSYSWQAGLNAFTAGWDDIRVNLTGNGNGSTVAAEIALTSDGVTPQSGWNAITLPASNGSVSFPASGYPHKSLQSWTANAVSPATVMHNFAAQNAQAFSGSVTASGTAVTLVGAGPIPLSWTAGSRMFIAGTDPTCPANECTIASITDASHVVLSQNLGTYAGLSTTLSGAIIGGAATFTVANGAGVIQVPANATGAAGLWYKGFIEGTQFLCTTKVSNTFSNCSQPQAFTVAGLPPASDNNGNFFNVTNGLNATDCTVGGGATLLTCKSNGSVWSAFTHPNGAAVTSTDFFAQNFGVLVRKPGAGTLRVDGITFDTGKSDDYLMPQDGIYDLCNPATVTDSGGVQGYLCLIKSSDGSLFFVPVDPFANAPRFLGQVLFGSLGSGADATTLTHCTALGAYDPADPNGFFCAAGFANNGFAAVVKARYNPAGVGGCTATADYQALPMNGPVWPYNCNITAVLATPQTTGRDPTSQAIAMDSDFDVNAFGGGGISGSQNGMLGISWSRQQDAMAWLGWVDPVNNFNLVSLTNTFTKGTFGARYCGNHNLTPFGNTNTVTWTVAFLANSTNFGYGPWSVKVNTALTNTAGGTCTGVTDPYALSQIAAGQGCVSVTVDRARPCRYNPAAYETANYPDCAGDPAIGARQLPQTAGALRAGDVLHDNAANEYIMLMNNTGGNTWQALRLWRPFEGALLDQQDVQVLQNHSAGWTAEVVCNSMTFGGGTAAYSQNDLHGANMAMDWTFTPSSHADIQNGLFLAAGYTYRGGWPSTVGKAVTASNGAGGQTGGTMLSNGSFAGNRGNGEYNTYDNGVGSTNAVGSHVSLSRDPNNTRWFFDGNAFENANTAGYGLWTQLGSTVVSGSLYKIPKASVIYQNYYPNSLKTHDLGVFAGKWLLKNISGPGSVIDGTAGNNYNFCVAWIANECVAGSVQGDVYANIPQNGVTAALLTPTTITSITNAVPPVVTDTAHGYTAGQQLSIVGNSNSAYNGLRSVRSVIDANTFTLDGYGSAQGTGSGGTAVFAPLCNAGLLATNSLCVTPLGPENGYVNQYFMPINSVGIPGTSTMRRITTAFGRYGSQYVFNNARGSANGKFFITDTPWIDGYRSAIWIGKLPPPPNLDTTPRNTFVGKDISVGAVAGYPKAYLRFGYAENGTATLYYCTQRQEECRTSSAPTTADPYWFASDTSKTYPDVTSGGTLTLPVIPGRVAYYQIVRCIDNTCAVPLLDRVGVVAAP